MAKYTSYPPPSVLISSDNNNIYWVFVPVKKCFICIFAFIFTMTHEVCAVVILIFHVRKLWFKEGEWRI